MLRVAGTLFAGMTPRRWIEYTAAILVGNGIYFFVLFSGLPRVLQHQPRKIDAGLILDFACCLAVYAVIRLGVAHARRHREGPPRGSPRAG